MNGHTKPNINISFEDMAGNWSGFFEVEGVEGGWGRLREVVSGYNRGGPVERFLG